MDKIIGLGNALVDVLALIDDDNVLQEMELPKGSMQLIDRTKYEKIKQVFSTMETQFASGGSAGNTILALGCLNAKPAFIGKVGKDDSGRFLNDYFTENGIQADLIASHLPTGTASTFISTNGERTFGTYLGAAATLSPEDISEDLFEGYQYLYIEGYLVQNHDLILKAIQAAKAKSLQVCIDLASYNIVKEDHIFFKQLIRDYVDIVFANEQEAAAYTNKEHLDALYAISKECSIAVVKLGSKGSIVKKGTDVVCVKAQKVEQVVDTTGAGDYYSAGFLYGLTHGFSFDKCAKLGNLLSSEVIQVVGTTISPDRWKYINEKILEIQTLNC
jgi:sugar/nucleoside kinase (ribokinase family)